MEYVLDEAATEVEERSNDCSSTVVRDKGHGGKRLCDFMAHTNAVEANLDVTHVAALRLYSSKVYKRINEPLRRGQQPHPFAATTLFLSEALKMLRAVYAGNDEHESVSDDEQDDGIMRARRRSSSGLRASSLAPTELWRGMKDLTLTADFVQNGGTEFGCMSTSTSKETVAAYAQSRQPLVFRVLPDDFMSCGADISWLSVYPTEAEVLFPPLTYLKYVKMTPIENSDGFVVTVRPSFAT
jgi:hypothetical protein